MSNETDGANTDCVIFYASGNKFAVNCKYVLAIEKAPETVDFADFSHGGETIGVYDLNKLFGQVGQKKPEHNIILQVGNKKTGLIVDHAEGVEAVGDIQELPPAAATTGYIKKIGLGKKNGEIIFIFEPGCLNRFLNSQ